MGSETLPSTLYVLYDESKYPFTLRVTGIKNDQIVQHTLLLYE